MKRNSVISARRFCWIAAAFVVVASARAGGQGADRAPGKSAAELERVAELNLEAARKNPLQLRAFLYKMPKGADLHSHLTGAVYAESFIRAAKEDDLCVNVTTLSFAKPVLMTESAPPQPFCGEGKVPAAQAYKDQHLYDALIDSFSMRGFVPSPGVTGHDHFFDTFGKYGGTDSRHTGEWVDEVATRAAAQNEQYLELMVSSPYSKISAIAKKMVWSENFADLRDKILKEGLQDDLAAAKAFYDQAESVRKEREKCGQPDESVACSVQVRYIYQVYRASPKEMVFAQTLLGFEIASADPRVVGINYVQPEDGINSMADYNLHMRIVGFLHGIYPKIHVSLHAGELAYGLVPPEGLCCHIRLAVEQAGAERIGHGVDVMYEAHPHELMKEMAAKHVMVEINLSSNDLILGVSGKDHPFPMYRMFHVPVALSTDDEGVSRIDLTHEYVRAVESYDLKYADLKQMARTGIEHSFLPGASLWTAPDNFSHSVPACSGDRLGAKALSAPCTAFLKSSEKAQQQWELERRFLVFETSL
jgi:adenosine deaminase